MSISAGWYKTLARKGPFTYAPVDVLAAPGATCRLDVPLAWRHGGQLRDELLKGEIFYTLQEAKVIIECWRRHYKPALQHPSVYVIEGKRVC
jgi:hypothetical protein